MRSEASQPEDRPRPPSICNAAGIYGIGKREREAVAPLFHWAKFTKILLVKLSAENGENRCL